MANCKSCSHFEVCERYGAIVDFDVDDGVCRYYEKKLVRCAQCKHFKRNLENDTYCSSVNGLTDPQEDDFCSYGERKEGAD